MAYTWAVFHEPGGPAHVVPVHDVVEHEPTECVCSPSAEMVKRDNGSIGWVEVHHALDNREAHE